MKTVLLLSAAIFAASTAFAADNTAPDEKAALAALNAELPSLWDYSAIAKEPLDATIISSTTHNGWKSESIYINGVGGASGTDRIFFYYAHPEKPEGKIPAVIDITGGSVDDTRAVYLGKVLNSACVVMEWRCNAAKLRSQWVGGIPKYRVVGPLKTDESYRVITGARRVLDFLSQQDYIDPARLGCMGGSMGGIYTMLLSGVDPRVSAGVVDVGVGHLAHSDCLQGGFWLSPERKDIWLKAFDPYSHANAIKARSIVLPSSDDHFCALGDIVETYKAIPSEKRLCIDPNYDHSTPAFGGPEPHYPGLNQWLPYCFGQTDSYIKIPDHLDTDGYTCSLPTNGQDVKDAWLWFSPGPRDLIWQARYWVPVKAEVKDGKCVAKVPVRYAKLPRYYFMDVYNSKGQKASTLPAFKDGPVASYAPPILWENNQLWDVASGLGAWRPLVTIGDVPRVANLRIVPPFGIAIGPAATVANHKFVILTSSIGLVSAAAQKHGGLAFKIDGNGAPGELKLALFVNFNSAFNEQKFEYTLKYGKDIQTYSIPWKDFTNTKSPAASIFPFDTLRIEGVREDGTQITIHEIAFADP